MRLIPTSKTDEAELILTFTYHMVAALEFLDEHSALGASFPLSVVLNVMILAGSKMTFHHALFTKAFMTFLTGVWRL